MLRMASPQLENGYTAIANELLEAIIAAPVSGGQVRLLLHVMRATYGWKRPTERISAAEFARATGLHPKVVAREVRDLAARGYLLTLAEEGRTTSYRIQKDYHRWDTGNQKVPGQDEATGNQKVEGDGTKRFPDPELKGSPHIRKVKTTLKTTPENNTEPHGSGTLRDRFEKKYHDASNKTAVLGELFSLLLGSEPDYRRLGGMAKRLNSGGKLMDFIIDASKRRITDNPHDYLDGMITSETKRRRQSGVEEVVTIDGGKTISADAARKLTKFANVKLGGD